jgi:N-acetylglutamate synthase-like GNAT family acetyltransferase
MSGRDAPPYRIQAANDEQDEQIKQLVRGSGINPTGLDWARFLVAVNEEGEMIGCGQVKPHGDGSFELASLAVRPEWRRKGVATALIEALLATHPGTLYLMCQSSLGPLYKRFGFAAIPEEEMPKYFRRISKLAGVLEAVRAQGESLLIMRRDGA